MFWVVMPQYSTFYNASIIDKYDRLMSIDEPKIILVGDSNVAFGFDSVRIGQAFDMPVVNFGLHGGLGQAFHTDMIKPGINEGDIIIIIPVGYSDDSVVVRDPVMAWSAIENNFRLWRGISSANYSEMLLAFPTYLKRTIALFTTGGGNQPYYGLYSRASFSTHGDIMFPRPESWIVEGNYGSYFDNNELSETMITYWNEFNEFVESRNARLFMSGPAMLDNALTVDLSPLQANLEEYLDFPMISQLEELVYPSELFFDLNFHLNDRGVAVRSDQLIQDLRAALD